MMVSRKGLLFKILGPLHIYLCIIYVYSKLIIWLDGYVLPLLSGVPTVLIVGIREEVPFVCQDDMFSEVTGMLVTGGWVLFFSFQRNLSCFELLLKKTPSAKA